MVVAGVRGRVAEAAAWVLSSVEALPVTAAAGALMTATQELVSASSTKALGRLARLTV